VAARIVEGEGVEGSDSIHIFKKVSRKV
jgi:hypothetical protein